MITQQPTLALPQNLRLPGRITSLPMPHEAKMMIHIAETDAAKLVSVWRAQTNSCCETPFHMKCSIVYTSEPWSTFRGRKTAGVCVCNSEHLQPGLSLQSWNWLAACM